MADYVEDEFCGVDGVKEDQYNALSATDDFSESSGWEAAHHLEQTGIMVVGDTAFVVKHHGGSFG